MFIKLDQSLPGGAYTLKRLINVPSIFPIIITNLPFLSLYSDVFIIYSTGSQDRHSSLPAQSVGGKVHLFKSRLKSLTNLPEWCKASDWGTLEEVTKIRQHERSHRCKLMVKLSNTL